MKKCIRVKVIVKRQAQGLWYSSRSIPLEAGSQLPGQMSIGGSRNARRHLHQMRSYTKIHMRMQRHVTVFVSRHAQQTGAPLLGEARGDFDGMMTLAVHADRVRKTAFRGTEPSLSGWL